MKNKSKKKKSKGTINGVPSEDFMIYWRFSHKILYKHPRSQLDMTDRIAIETGILLGDSFKKIAANLGRHPSTISGEVKRNRSFIKGSFYHGNNCKYASVCAHRNVCGDMNCKRKCPACAVRNCHDYCPTYMPRSCKRPKSPPYVCNRCSQRGSCVLDRYIYSSKLADQKSSNIRSQSRSNIHVKGAELEKLDKLITSLLKKGQPLSHIYAEHQDEIPVSIRTLYNYIENRQLTARPLDLRRQVGYRKRKSSRNDEDKPLKGYRIGRTYSDFLYFMSDKSEDAVTQMDTVVGTRGVSQRLLTMIMRKNSVMLIFLIPDGTSSSVIDVFDYLEQELGSDAFMRLFPVILTDNGAEFQKADDLEVDQDGVLRTSVFYCDAMASWQKGHLEKNHEFIRYVIPKGKSMANLTPEKVTLLMNHINSTKRPALDGKCPYELVDPKDQDMSRLMRIMKMHLIPPDEVHLKPDLIR